MDEILASIRRIISDDQDAGRGVLSAPLTHPSLHAAEVDLREFEQDDSMDETPDHDPEPETDMAPPATYDTFEAQRAVDLDELRATETATPVQTAPFQTGGSQRRPEPVVPVPPPASVVTQPPRGEASYIEELVSQETTASVGDAFHNLAHTVLSKNARTLEDLVRDMLRPMLKTWLDDNLPPLVERLVRAEIERVARGRP